MDLEFKEVYMRRRQLAEQAAEQRLNEVYDKCPKVRDIDADMKRIAIGLAARLRGAEDRDAVLAAVTDELSALSQSRAALLKDMGLPEDYTEPRYQCKKCRDTGYMGDEIKRPCDCLLQQRIAARFPETEIVKRQTFDNFDLALFPAGKQREQMDRARLTAWEYAESLPTPEKPNLLLLGAPGLGKSYLLNCIAHRAMERGHTVARMTAYAFISAVLEDIRAGRTPELYRWAELFILDDLGTEPMMQNITVEYLFILLNERLSEGLATAIATNLTAGELQDAYGERVFSRLVSPEYTKIYQLSGLDVRLKKK